MTTPQRPSPIREFLRFVGLCAATLLVGCAGGSGSSGFDIAESLVLERVTGEGRCEEFDGILICPANSPPEAQPTPTAISNATSTPSPTDTTDVPTPDVTPTIPGPPPTETPTASPFGTDGPDPTPTPTEAGTSTPSPTVMPSLAVVSSFVGQEDAQLCSLAAGVGGCTVRFEFSATGFPQDTAFRVASRRNDSEAPWRIQTATSDALPSNGVGFVTEIPVDLGDPALGVATMPVLQVVVLAFESDPGPVPEQVDTLADTGADFAYALPPFPIVVN